MNDIFFSLLVHIFNFYFKLYILCPLFFSLDRVEIGVEGVIGTFGSYSLRKSLAALLLKEVVADGAVDVDIVVQKMGALGL